MDTPIRFCTGKLFKTQCNYYKQYVQLYIDNVLINSTTPSGLYRKLDFNFQVEIGGRPEDQYSTDIETTFHGCLARLVLNNIDLLSMAPKTARDCQMPK